MLARETRGVCGASVPRSGPWRCALVATGARRDVPCSQRPRESLQNARGWSRDGHPLLSAGAGAASPATDA